MFMEKTSSIKMLGVASSSSSAGACFKCNIKVIDLAKPLSSLFNIKLLGAPQLKLSSVFPKSDREGRFGSSQLGFGIQGPEWIIG